MFRPGLSLPTFGDVYVALDLVLIAAFGGILAVRGHRWGRTGHASHHQFFQRELELWFDRVLVVIDSVETPPSSEDTNSRTF